MGRSAKFQAQPRCAIVLCPTMFGEKEILEKLKTSALVKDHTFSPRIQDTKKVGKTWEYDVIEPNMMVKVSTMLPRLPVIIDS